MRTAEERLAHAQRMSYTKVKPRVVKHVLDNQVLSIYEPTTHMGHVGDAIMIPQPSLGDRLLTTI